MRIQALFKLSSKYYFSLMVSLRWTLGKAVTASTTPSFVPMTDRLMTFNRSASSCASVRVVKVGRMVLPVFVESSSARFFADLRTDPAVNASLDPTRVSMLSPSSRSFTKPLPGGSLGLN